MAYVPYLTNMVVDAEGRVVSADVKINYVTAANIYPTAWENSRITECVLAFYKTYGRKKYAHLQHHKLEPWTDENGNDLGRQYVIENTVVECSSGAGRELTPSEWNKIPHFSGLAARVETGSNKPQFTIDKLNIVNNADDDSTNPMGVALFANSIDTLEKIDLEYDSYANEFVMGRKRLFVAPEMLTDSSGNQVFDPEDSVFYQLPEDSFKDSKEAIHEVNMELRAEAHEKAINDDLNLLSFKCGFGTQYYRFERGTVATATQVISENSDMYRTIRKHQQHRRRPGQGSPEAAAGFGKAGGLYPGEPDQAGTEAAGSRPSADCKPHSRLDPGGPRCGGGDLASCPGYPRRDRSAPWHPPGLL